METTPCDKIKDNLKKANTELAGFNEKLAELNKEKPWYEVIKIYCEKIDKAHQSPEAIIFSLDNQDSECLKIEARNVSTLTNGIVEGIYPCLLDVIKALNGADSAALKMDPVRRAVNEMEGNDEAFKKSEIYKTLDIIFKNIEEIKAKSSETLATLLNALKTAFALKDFTSENGLLIGQIKKMVDHANNSRQSSIEPKDHPNYYNQTKKEWTEEAAPKIKELNDLIANQTLAATLVEVYTAAKKANNCPA